MKRSLLALSIIFLLQGCVDTAISGAQALYNRHSIQNSLSDHYIAMKADRMIYIDSDRYKNTNITVSSMHGSVLMAGQVENHTQQSEVEKMIRQLSGVKELHDLTTVSAPSSAMTRVSDAWITTKIKTKFIAANEIDPGEIKIVTENGTVFLMGKVQPEQANAAVYLARTTDGVQQVVRIFSYLRESKV